MPTTQFRSAGADAARDYDAVFRQILANDPDVQASIRKVWGDTPLTMRPSDTPKHLESANAASSKEIARILSSKGITLPDRTFVNPRTASLEGHRGWSGLSGLQKAAIIAAASAAGVGGAAALGAFGGAAGGGAAGGAASGASAGAGAGAGAAGSAAGTAAGAGTAMGTGIMSQIGRYAPLAMMGTSLLGRAFGGGNQQQAPQGTSLQELAPLIMAMMQQSQQQQQQQQAFANRQMLLTDPGAASLFPGMTAPQGAVPLREAIAQMAYRMMPTYATGGR